MLIKLKKYDKEKKKNMKRLSVFISLIVIIVFLGGMCFSAEIEAFYISRSQTKCPVTGKLIDKKIYVDTNSYRIYVCSNTCIEKVKSDPQKFIKKFLENGEDPEKRIVVCQKCGEIKDSEKCCAKDAPRCKNCGLIKDSLGCCKNLKPVKDEKDIVLCPSCGEIKGSEKCCNIDAIRCEKCKLDKDSPGCCKLDKIFKSKPQTTCPISGKTINRKFFADYKGKRIYFSDDGCDQQFMNSPDKYIKDMESKGIVSEKVSNPQTKKR